MPNLTFCGEPYTVDHAVKGTDYIHGYDANGILVVAFEDVADLTAIGYDGEFMAPGDCAAEVCNKVVYCGGRLKTLGGVEVTKGVAVELAADGWTDNTQTVNVAGVTDESIVIASAAPASREVYGDSGIYCAAQSAGALTFKCESAPSVAVTANVIILA